MNSKDIPIFKFIDSKILDERYRICGFLLVGYSATDLTDERVFPNPYTIAEAFDAVLYLNEISNKALASKGMEGSN